MSSKADAVDGQCAALMITMLLGGLWHGASWTFVVWGSACSRSRASRSIPDCEGRFALRHGKSRNFVSSPSCF